MLAAKATYETITFPIHAQAKLDGIRCLARRDQALSRSLKPIPNKFIQKFFSCWSTYLDGMDGELIVGPATAPDVYRRTSSAVMSEDGNPRFTYWVFDFPKPDLPYFARRGILRVRTSNIQLALEQHGTPWSAHNVVLLQEHRCLTLDELKAYEQEQLKAGFEGLILRNKDAVYKSGRSTLKEQGLLKLKQFADDEAEIVGFEELFHNANTAQTSELGLTKRSTHKANKVPMNTLGALIVKSPKWAPTFNIGSGFDVQERKFIWAMREELKGQMVKFKHLPIGAKDVPRFPIYLGFRDKRDMDPNPNPNPQEPAL